MFGEGCIAVVHISALHWTRVCTSVLAYFVPSISHSQAATQRGSVKGGVRIGAMPAGVPTRGGHSMQQPMRASRSTPGFGRADGRARTASKGSSKFGRADSLCPAPPRRDGLPEVQPAARGSVLEQARGSKSESVFRCMHASVCGMHACKEDRTDCRKVKPPARDSVPEQGRYDHHFETDSSIQALGLTLRSMTELADKGLAQECPHAHLVHACRMHVLTHISHISHAHLLQALELTLRSMTEHADKALVQEYGCGTLWNLVMANPPIKVSREGLLGGGVPLREGGGALRALVISRVHACILSC